MRKRTLGADEIPIFPHWEGEKQYETTGKTKK